MKYGAIAFFLLLNTVLVAQELTILEDASSVDFVFLDGDVKGTLSDFKFTGKIDLSNIELSQFSGSVATSTIDTNNWLRSRHLKGNKFFNAKSYPRLLFSSNTTSLEGDTIVVSGQLTMKGITKDAVFRFTRNDKKLIGKARINTQDYNLVIYKERERNFVKITIAMNYING